MFSILRQSKRTKVILPRSHYFEYFKNSYNPKDPKFPPIQHPEPITSPSGEKGPLYFKITLLRSMIGLPWQKKYETGILFKYYSPLKQYKPKSVQPDIPVQTTIFREATPETAELILRLKELVKVENIWNETQYREEAKKLLNKYALTTEELQDKRGYYLIKNVLTE